MAVRSPAADVYRESIDLNEADVSLGRTCSPAVSLCLQGHALTDEEQYGMCI